MSSGLLQVFVELGNLHGTSNYVETTGVACSDSVCHDRVQVLSIPVYYSLIYMDGVNLYMEYFEEMALGSTSLKPSMWLRYVDDTFILWPHQEDVQILLDHVNSIRPSVQFTMEKEQDIDIIELIFAWHEITEMDK